MAENLRLNFRLLRSRLGTGAQSSKEVEIVEKISTLVEVVPKHDDDSVHKWIEDILSISTRSLLNASEIRWTVVGFLITLLTHAATLAAKEEQLRSMKSICLQLLEHEEVRVRMQTSELLGKLSERIVTEITMNEAYRDLLDSFSTDLFGGLVRNWQRTETTREVILGAEERVQLDDTTGWNYLESYLNALHALILGLSAGASKHFAVQFMLHHTVKCPNNESESITISCAELLITQACTHINRHVRETTFKFIADLLREPGNPVMNPTSFPPHTMLLPSSATSTCQGINTQQRSVLQDQPLQHSVSELRQWYEDSGRDVADRIHTALLSGLQDDWSQIRHTAALACQAFLISLSGCKDGSGGSEGSEGSGVSLVNVTATATISLDPSSLGHRRAGGTQLLATYWPGILPRLCMNRFYPAPSVQTVSHNTWRTVLGPHGLGRTLLSQYAQEAAEYYCTMTAARNHMVSEAACHAVAELVEKIDASAVEPHVPVLLQALWLCLKDPRWPVRDAAIVASAVVTRRFSSDRTVRELLPQLLAAWSENLTDFIWSVREHAAMAFGLALQCCTDAHAVHTTVTTDTTASTSSGSNAPTQHATGQPTSWAAQVQGATVLATARTYIRENLYFWRDGHVRTIAATDNGTVEAGVRKNVPKVKNFLPEALLQADRAAKAEKQQQLEKHSEAGGTTDPAVLGSATTTTAPATAMAAAPAAGELRKGWGCCIDCVELRSCQPWEVTHGAVYLLREIALVQPAVLLEPFSEQMAAAGEGASRVQSGESGETVLGALVRVLGSACGAGDGGVGSDGIGSSGVGSAQNVSVLLPPPATLPSVVPAPPPPSGDSLLAAAVLEEIPMILSAAMRNFPQARWEEHREALCLDGIIQSLTSVLRQAQKEEAAATAAVVNSTATSGSGRGSGPSVSSASAAGRRTQQAARRSARNKDKVVVAAERCLAALPQVLSNSPTAACDGQQPQPQPQLPPYGASAEGAGNTDPAVVQAIAALFPEDVRAQVESLLLA